MRLPALPAIPGAIPAVLAAVVAAALLAACATPAPRTAPSYEGDVGFRALVPEGAERLQIPEEQVFQLGRVIPDDRVLPNYPETLLGRAPPTVAVCAELHVDGEGAVYHALPLVQGGECPALPETLAGPFHAAVLEAVRQWRFEPSYVCARDEGMVYDDCDEPGKPREAVALLRAYRFEFTQREGRGSVAVGEQR